MDLEDASYGLRGRTQMTW